jgi:hypothetical protein
MSQWRIDSFAGLTLPAYNATSDQSTGAVASPLVRVAGGTYDAAGSAQRLPPATQYAVRGVYAEEEGGGTPYARWVTPADRLVRSAGGDGLQIYSPALMGVTDRLGQLRALVGTLGTLTRYAWRAPEVVQSVEARLLQVRHSTRRELRNGGGVEVECSFECQSPFWEEALVQTAVINGKTLWIDTGSRAPIERATLALAWPSVVGSWRVLGGGNDISYAGAAATAFAIGPAGISGGSGLGGVTFGAGHTHAGFLRLPVGLFGLAVSGMTGTLSWRRLYG